MRAETEAAIQAVKTAQRMADSREDAAKITSKGGIDLVAGADVACEDAIRLELTRVFPQYPVVGEERAGTPIAVHIAAGCLIAAEAGAKGVDADTGAPWNIQTRSLILPATPELGEQLLDLVRS